MKYSDLKDAIRQRTGITEKDIDAVLDAQRDIVIEESSAGNEVRLPDFGKFQGVDRAGRKGRNPKTGEEIQIAAKRVLKFSPFDAAKARVNIQ